MTTPDTTPSNSIDFESVSIEDAAKVASPAEQTPVSQEALDKKFMAPVTLASHQEDIDKAAQKLAELQRTAPESAPFVVETPVQVPLATVETENKSTPEEFIKDWGMEGTFGKNEKAIASELRNKKWGDDQNGLFSLTTGAVGTAVAVPLAISIGSEIAALGGMSYLAALPTISLGILGVGAVAGIGLAGMLGYYGVKTIKNFRARRAFEKTFGKSVEDPYYYRAA
jgi:hypothetical protein